MIPVRCPACSHLFERAEESSSRLVTCPCCQIPFEPPPVQSVTYSESAPPLPPRESRPKRRKNRTPSNRPRDDDYDDEDYDDDDVPESPLRGTARLVLAAGIISGAGMILGGMITQLATSSSQMILSISSAFSGIALALKALGSGLILLGIAGYRFIHRFADREDLRDRS